MASESPARMSDMVRELARAGLMREQVGSKTLPPLKAYLRAWQSRRLATTYANLLASPEFGPACRFFLTDIYAPQDFSQRDADIARIVGLMRKVLPEQMTHGAVAAMELNELSNRLDDKLLDVLRTQLGVREAFTQEQYEEAYRLCQNYQERVYQIDLIVDCGRTLASVHHLPFARRALRAAHLPARMFGWAELHDFLERGFQAWVPVRNPDYMLQTIQEREMAILNRIYRLP